MTANGEKDTSKKTENLLIDLHALLEKQIELAHKGDITGVESLSNQAGILVDEIMETKQLESDEFKNQLQQLQKLYQHLSLSIAAQKTETSEQLSRIRKGKKTIAAYRGNI